jgi:glycine hydroxymethyltransferase
VSETAENESRPDPTTSDSPAELSPDPTTTSGAAADRALEALATYRTAVDDDGLVLYAGTNALSPAVEAAHDPQIATRPPGVGFIDEIAAIAARAVAAVMRAPQAEIRPPSATIANLAVYAALTEPGDTIAALPERAGGHASHHASGAAGVRGLRVVELPYADFDVDLARLEPFLAREKPRLIVVGGTLMLFPYRLQALVELARAANAQVLYDASHVAGLIAGGAFQDPLREGAGIMTFSTYKSFGGPPGGAIAAPDPDIAEAITKAVTGLTTNYDAGRLVPLTIAAAELQRTGGQYARACIANARRLGAALAARGLDVLAADRGYTASHHLAVHAPAASAARLADAGIHASAATATVLRLGTQELTRRGFGEAAMDDVADLMGRVLLDGEPPSAVREDVRALRAAL